MKKILILLFGLISIAGISQTDFTPSDQLKPFNWEPISGVDKILQYDNEKDMSKNARKKLTAGNNLYVAGVGEMKKKKYKKAIESFSEALKNYKRAKISNHAYNYIYINMALSYAHTPDEKDRSVAKRFISLVTPKIEKEKEWLYNLAIAKNRTSEDYNEAANDLSKAIRLDQNYFQAYITLEEVYRSNNNKSSADKVRDRMESAEAILIKRTQKKTRKNDNKKPKKENNTILTLEGIKPDVKDLNIVIDDNLLQYNKMSLIKDRSMKIVQDGVGDYNNGVKELSKKNPNYQSAVELLKEADKKLKRGKINENGLNFARGNLAIAYLCLEEKSKLSQVKRNLSRLTNKIYSTRDWSYNLGVAYYCYGSQVRGSSKELFIKESIKLLKLSIKHDKLYLNPYANLVYIYNEMNEQKKAEKYQKLYNKQRDKLLQSFDREEQIKMGVENEYIFRVYLGNFGEYEAPADMFDEEYLITVPINNTRTAYLSGRFFTLNEAKSYLKSMIERGYEDAKIRAYKDGEKIEF